MANIKTIKEKKHFWHNLSSEKVADILGTNIEKGLSLEAVSERREAIGYNEIPQKKALPNLKVFFSQFRSPLIYILIFAGAITLFMGKWEDSLVIFIALFINALFGFWEEKKTSKILEKLKLALKTETICQREGRKIKILQRYLVPGDIVFLRTGSKVPADGRLIEVNDLKIDESILTGEWLANEKNTAALPENTPLSDRDNMAYMGCLIESGEGKMIVTETGVQAQTGKIADLVRNIKQERSPLQRKLAIFSKILGIIIGAICVLIFAGGVIRGGSFLEMFEAAVAMAVGGIPEALPVTMTVVLAIGMERILRKKGLIKKLSAVETLGSTQIICFDKTKTLTEGKMEVAEIIAKDRKFALKIAVLCNGAFIENSEKLPEFWKIIGSPTDKALIEKGKEENILKPKLEEKSIEISKLPFDSNRKYLLSLRKENEKTFLYISGAPDRILEKVKNQENWQKQTGQLAKKGLRVIAVASKQITNFNFGRNLTKENWDKLSNNFNFEGIIGLRDPLRPEAKEAIRTCQEAGMKPILITGDYKLTAKAVAEEIGIKIGTESVLEGQQLDKLSDDELEKILEKTKIYARVEARHKARIVRAWQDKGKVVAMIGDGVNDAPALRRADIGIGLASGTETAKETSDLILLDDSFNIIIKAVEEGRVIMDNLRKSIAYVLGDSFASIILIGFSKIIFGWPLPILPVQILWNNFVEDTLPSISYAFEPKEKEIMKRKPTARRAPLLTKEMKVLIFATGLIDQFVTLGLFWLLWKRLGLNLDYARTMIFGAISLDTAFVVYSYKNLKKNIWQINLFSNKWLILSSLTTFFAFSIAIYFPPLQKILHTVPLGIGSWLILGGIGILSVFLIEATKYYFITRHLIKK